MNTMNLRLLGRGALVAGLVILLGACETLPDDAFRLSETALETREIQTWRFEDVTELDILSASTGVLQDLGYSIDEVDKQLGVLSASKRANATNPAEVAGRIAVDAMTCWFTFLLACDNENYKKSKAEQDIRLTLVVFPSQSDEMRHSVRVTMQRIVWDREGRVVEKQSLEDPEVYQAFFAKLSESVFLEKEEV